VSGSSGSGDPMLWELRGERGLRDAKWPETWYQFTFI